MPEHRRTRLAALFILIAATVGGIGRVPIGPVTLADLGPDYYAEFDRARRAIERAVPPHRIAYSGVNRDLFLEEFHFKATTTSGRTMRIWFDGSNMDVDQVCNRPVGVIFYHRAHARRGQRFASRTVASWVAPGTATITVDQILRNAELIEHHVVSKEGDENKALTDGGYSWDCLRIDYAEDDELESFRYVGVHEQDVRDFP